MELATLWDSKLDSKLVQLVEGHLFDFETAAKALRKAIQLEEVKTRTSTRHRANEFTEEACRVRFFEIDSGLGASEGVEEQENPETNEHEALPLEEDQDGEEVEKKDEDNVFGEGNAHDSIQIGMSASITLELDSFAEAAILEMGLEEFNTSNQEVESISELGQVIQMLEGKHFEPGFHRKQEEAFLAFSKELSLATLGEPPVPPKKEIERAGNLFADFETKERLESNSSSSSKEKVQISASQSARTSSTKSDVAGKKSRELIPGTLEDGSKRRGTREEVYAYTECGDNDEEDDEASDWREVRRTMKSNALATN